MAGMNQLPIEQWLKQMDWEKLETKLMIRQDPVTRKARLKFYKEIDDSGGGALDVKELKLGLTKLLVDHDGTSLVPMGDELMPAITCAFDAAKNLEKSSKKKKVQTGKKAKVGMLEFHAFLVAFKYYLQLVELFEIIDGQADDNQKLSLRECKRAAMLLEEWGITNEELEEKFSAVPAWESYMPFKQFAKWCIEESGALNKLECDNSDAEDVVEGKVRHTVQKEHGVEMKSDGHGVVARQNEENEETVQELFKKWDKDGSGNISEEELSFVLQDLGMKLSDDQFKKLFESADHNKDGSLCYREFLNWVLE